MNKNRPQEQFYLLKLLFDPKKQVENLEFPLICKYIRNTFGITQPVMAEKLGVRLTTYQYWEYGKREPSSKAAANLCLLYLQCLYINKQTPKTTEMNALLDSVLSEENINLQHEHDTFCAA